MAFKASLKALRLWYEEPEVSFFHIVISRTTTQKTIQSEMIKKHGKNTKMEFQKCQCNLQKSQVEFSDMQKCFNIQKLVTINHFTNRLRTQLMQKKRLTESYTHSYKSLSSKLGIERNVLKTWQLCPAEF